MGKMINISINIPVPFDNMIQELIQKEIIPSRSEGIRIALRDFLLKEFEFYMELIKKDGKT